MSFSHNLVIGRYSSGNSILHRLDPRTKLISFLAITTAVFFLSNPLSYLLVSGLILVGILLGNLKLRLVFRGILPILWIILFTFLLHTFFTPGTRILSLGLIGVSQRGLITGVHVVLRLIFLVLIASLLTCTTPPQELAKGIEFLLWPLKIFGISPQKIAMMITLSLRFLPFLFVEVDRLISCQISRGADLSHRNPVKRIRAVIPIVLPLLLNLFRKAEEFSLAMELRGYDPDQVEKSGLDGRFKLKDGIILLGVVCFSLGLVFL